MKSVARLTFDKVLFNKDNDLHLVVSLTAPKVNVQKRPPIMIMPVIDISGSMDGSKLEFAKQSVLKMIDHLQPGDFTGLITFESNVNVVSPPVEITQTKKDELKAKVSKLRTAGSTAFSGGMLAALEQVNKLQLGDDVLIRIIMFTDGCANVGIKGRDMLPLLENNLGKASLSAFGYGSDADQELLADLARVGKGNYAFIANPDDAPAAFAKELGGLLSTYAQNITVEVMPQGDHQLTEVVSDVKIVTDVAGGPIASHLTTLKIPELLSEETRNLVIKMKALRLSQADLLPADHASPMANIKITYDVLEQGKMVKHTEELVSSVMFVNPGDEQTKATQEVDAMVALAQMVKAQAEAERLAAAGQYDSAVYVMNNISEDFNARGHEGISVTTSKIGSKMRSRTAYAASAGYRTSTARAGSRAMGLSSSDDEAQADLSEIGVVYTNSSQEEVMKSFEDEKTTPPDTVTPQSTTGAK